MPLRSVTPAAWARRALSAAAVLALTASAAHAQVQA